MKKSQLARAIAKQNRLKTGDAADQVDRAVTTIIRTLRRGNAARLPGLGTIKPGKPWTFRPDADGLRNEPTPPAEAAGMPADEVRQRPESRTPQSGTGKRREHR